MTDRSDRLRPEVYDTYVRPIDRLGRQQLRRFGMPTIGFAIPAFMGRWREVPSEFWAKTVGDDGFTVVDIACPCGHDPRVEIGTTADCECGRIFWFNVNSVLASNAPEAPAGPVDDSRVVD